MSKHEITPADAGNAAAEQDNARMAAWDEIANWRMGTPDQCQTITVLQLGQQFKVLVTETFESEVQIEVEKPFPDPEQAFKYARRQLLILIDETI